MVTQQHPERHRSAVHGRMTDLLQELDGLALQALGLPNSARASASAARAPNRCQRLEPPMRPTQLASRVVSASIAVRSPTNHRASMRHRRPHLDVSATGRRAETAIRPASPVPRCRPGRSSQAAAR